MKEYPPLQHPLTCLLHLESSNKRFWPNDHSRQMTPFSKLTDKRINNKKEWNIDELKPNVKIGDRVESFGSTFYWTKNHLKGFYFEPLRLKGDVFVDNILQQLSIHSNDDIFKKLIISSDKNSVQLNKNIKILLKQVHTVPKWLNVKKIKEGQEFFKRHLPTAFISLLYFSLMGGFIAPKINQVLTRGAFRKKENVHSRLMETLSMVLDCMNTTNELLPGGNGWKSIIRVRFLHGRVRKHLLQMPDWDEQIYGKPINQQDMATTIAAFSILMMTGLSCNGITIKEKEAEAYLHVWKYIAYLIGIEDTTNINCNSLIQSNAWIESLVKHVVHPDDSSMLLMNNLASFRLFSNGINLNLGKWFIPPNVYNMVGLKHPSFIEEWMALIILCTIWWIDNIINRIPFLSNYVYRYATYRVHKSIGSLNYHFPMKYSYQKLK